MTKKYNKSTPKSKKLEIEDISKDSSPDKILNTSDPGDETQKRFRYQHAYGVILLTAAICNEKPYTAIWCEHHEDILGERPDGLYDGYQVKTQQPNYGLWNLSKEPLKDSIKRFVELDQKFPTKIRELYFVSNVGYENSTANNKIELSPTKLLKAIEHIVSQDDIVPPFDKAFEKLRAYCGMPSRMLCTEGTSQRG